MPAPLHARLTETPLGGDDRQLAAMLADTGSAAPAGERDLLESPRVRQLLGGVLAGSPYLSGLAQRDPARLRRLLACVPEAHCETLLTEVAEQAGRAETVAEMLATLRRFKAEVALLTALCDLGGVWPVMTVTQVLSRAADAAMAASVRFLFRHAHLKGDWLGGDEAAGYIVLGMGKYGAGELNYSSDIDLIVFYDIDRARLKDGLEPQAFFVRVTRDLVKLMQQRTGDGYVFRTDLRLRPDAGATQIALSTRAALNYYESYGQNWERAAMIKARPVAGDLTAGRRFLAELAPYIWRKYLDYAAIADIHAMKRQIHVHHGFGTIGVAGHNIKLGRGGIREIEFFAQTQQLIAGGRQPDLRAPQTLVALERLAERGWIKPEVRDELAEAYRFLRRLEHRLQMVADEQTHELPEGDRELEGFARFAGFAGAGELAHDLVRRLEVVQRHYARLFEDTPELTRGGANMVFAGAADDPATLAALAAMGYAEPAQIIATVRGWHHGRYPAVRSAKARERLTEVQPALIEALAATADPHAALVRFDRFLSELPTGVQLFALLRANPNLMRLVADIMGSAPRLARILSRRRRVLDAVLDPRLLGASPSAAELAQLIAAELDTAADFQEVLDRARVIGNEQAFLIGVRLLSGIIGPGQAGRAYALLAELVIQALQGAVEADFAKVHGQVAGGGAAVVALGKLGGREMTASSDLDLIVVYNFQPEAIQSDGPRPLPVPQYYSRLTQRLISALAAPTAEGQLYPVDMRLRPSGQKGPVATQLSSFIDYQAREAWTWEHMALTRARVITGPPALRAKVEDAIRRTLLRPRDRVAIARDVREMRQRILAEKATDNIWDLKQARGGLVDLEFMAQHLQLVHAAERPEVLDTNTVLALQKLEHAGLVPGEAASRLVAVARLLNDMTQVLRLCLDSPFVPAEAPDGLKALLARVAGTTDFARLDQDLRRSLAVTAGLFEVVVA